MRQQFTFYYTSSSPIFKDYMETRRSEWEEENDFIVEQVRAIYLKKYKNLLTLGIWSTKNPKDAQILSLVGLDQNIADESKKSYERLHTSNRDTTKEEPSYIRDLPHYFLEDPKCGVVNKKNIEKNTGGVRNTALANASGSTTIQNTTGSGTEPHQETEEALRNQARETATRI